MITGFIKGDKFERTIEVMETGEHVAELLKSSGYEPTYFLAKRIGKGGREFVSMVMKNSKTGEYTYAF